MQAGTAPVSNGAQPSTNRQQAKRNSKCLSLVVVILVPAAIARPLPRLVSWVPLTVVEFTLRTLLSLIGQDLEASFGASVVLWLVFGGHKRFAQSSWANGQAIKVSSFKQFRRP
jgi:hypothetical protein